MNVLIEKIEVNHITAVRNLQKSLGQVRTDNIIDTSMHFVENIEIHSRCDRPSAVVIFNEWTNSRIINVQDMF